jgi:hypothetical protein
MVISPRMELNMSWRKKLQQIEEALADPENKEFAEAYYAELWEKQEQFRQSVLPLVETLQRRGIVWPPGEHIGRLIRGARGAEVVDAMLEAVGKIQDIAPQRTVVGCFAYYDYEYDATALIYLFDHNQDPELRREICEIIPQTKARNADAWAQRVLTDPAYGHKFRDCRVELAFWSADLENTDGIADLLVPMFEEMPLFVPYPLGQLAEERHLEFLRDRLAHVEDYPAEVRKNLQENLTLAISKAEKRLAREAARKERLALKEAEKQRLRAEKQQLRDEQRRIKAAEQERIKAEREQARRDKA